ncbi:NUDIX pyrophosphatase [Longibacter salinarum]|uniref:NUDIX pyrophosphatase n=1 Tax=Longibacter salinarum TaxID=1850348 RepID=A0A2A8CYE1_9BACT|nr:NUDIX pyrophosphatase [Longibacter salinarum]PEN13398.1 NUDIX pyrophosphatase [Longibacter salinarum]
MPNASIRVVDVYPYRLTPEAGMGVELLLLRRADGTSYEGTWRMVGGGIDSGEAAWETAKRELLEETGCTPDRLWALPSVNTFYEWKTDRISLTPAFAAELPDANITLNAEHDEYRWFTPADACSELAWPEQQRLALLTAEMATSPIPPSLHIPSDVK